MKNKLFLLAATSLLLLSFKVNAALVHGVDTTIISVATYGRGSVTGDVRVKVADTVAGCEHGYYLTNDNAGKEEMLSIALSAFHASANVKINAYDEPRWAGSGGNYCEIEAIILSK